MADTDPRAVIAASARPISTELEATGLDDPHLIGDGGFGPVYRCRQVQLDRIVAVRFLPAGLHEEDRERFFREQGVMSRLSGNPNIVSVLQVGMTNRGRPYLVMPFYAHYPLDVEIQRTGPISVEEMSALGVKMAAALAAAHRHGLLHRDVKPANIIRTEYGEPVLTDFGIAHVSGRFETAQGAINGSAAFLAPELLKGQPPTAAADVYGLGATLFWAVTGRAALDDRWNGEQSPSWSAHIATDPVPMLREHGIADDVSVLVERSMSEDPLNRPSAVELGEQLRHIQRCNGFATDTTAVELSEQQRGAGPHSRENLGSTADSRHELEAWFPSTMASFVGRRREVSQAKKLLEESRVVTLTGIGGVGKTCLGLRVAERVKRAFPGGVWLVGIAELRDASLLVTVDASSLGLRDESARRIRDVLVNFLRSKRMLLVLDNCEQVVGAVAELVEELVRSCPELHVLVTSREALAVGGERVLRVQPLSVPDADRHPSITGLSGYEAVRLFVDRGATALPGFALTEENQEAVAGICRSLEGLPLSIELAAARLRAISPEQILERFSDRFALLTGGTRNAPTRQRTLRFCIDWSYELCTAAEQLVWMRLSIFAGSFELDAAEAICGYDMEPTDLLDVVTSLLDKSILSHEEAGRTVRFRMLEILRKYGQEKAQQSGEYSQLRMRQEDWYRQLVVHAESEWITSRQLGWITRLRREQSNLREVIDFCLIDNPASGLRIANALFQFWHARSMFSEGRHWFDRLLERESGRPTVERVKALYGASFFAEKQGALASARTLVEEARGLAERASDAKMAALAAYAEGLYALFTGDLLLAASTLERSVAVFTEPEDHILRVEALWMLGLTYGWQGGIERSILCLEEILMITRGAGESVFQGCSLWALGVALWRQGDGDEAVLQLQEGLRLARVARDQVGAATCLETLAWIAQGVSDTRQAVVLMGAAETLSHAAGSSSAYLPNLRDLHDTCERTSRSALSSSAFDTARQEGKAMTFNEAIAYALHERPPARTKRIGSTTSITKREQQVAGLVAQGMTNKAIAAQLVISTRTAQGHVEHILTKLGFTSRSQIAVWVAERDAQ